MRLGVGEEQLGRWPCTVLKLVQLLSSFDETGTARPMAMHCLESGTARPMAMHCLDLNHVCLNKFDLYILRMKHEKLVASELPVVDNSDMWTLYVVDP